MVRHSRRPGAHQWALRLGIRPASLYEREKNEAKGAITLATLKRAAEALDCTLVYALVPNQSLDAIVKEAAKSAAQKQLAASFHTMELEGHGVRAADKGEMVEELAADIAKAGGKRLWRYTTVFHPCLRTVTAVA